VGNSAFSRTVRRAQERESRLSYVILIILCAILAYPNIRPIASSNSDIDPSKTTLFLPIIGKPKNQWIQTSLGIPQKANFIEMAISPNFSEDKTIFASTNNISGVSYSGSLYRSNDEGLSWKNSGYGLNDSPAYKLAFSPDYKNDQTLFGGLSPGCTTTGLYRSTDGAHTWHQSGDFSQLVRDIAISPNFHNDHTVFATEGNIIFRSEDGGSIWEPVFNSPEGMYNLTSVAISPNYAIDKTVFVSRYLFENDDKWLLRSTDSGNSWVELSTPITSTAWGGIDHIELSPNFTSDNTLFVRAGISLYGSNNDGQSWQRMADKTFEYAFDFEVSPNFGTDQTLFAFYKSSIYRSRDQGNSWMKVYESPSSSSFCSSIHLSPKYSTDAMVYAACDVLLRSSDGGDNWYFVSEGIIRNVLDLELSPDYLQDGTIFGAAQAGGVIKSIDKGGSWKTKNEGQDFKTVFDVEMSPAYPIDQTVFAADLDIGIVKSSNGGDSWTNVYQEPGTLAISPNYSKDQTLLLTTWEDFFRSENGGLSWTRIPIDFPVNIVSFSPNYENDQKILVSTGYPYHVGISEDGGDTWNFRPADPGISKVIWSYDNQPILMKTFITGYFCLSKDLGVSWNCYSLPTSSSVHSIGISSNYPYPMDDTMYVGTGFGGVFVSKDGGFSWQEFNEGLGSYTINDLLVSPENPTIIFAATDWGVWQIRDP
jgi:photosystem II stability/assembly factor-like uncharacterized protein